MIEAPDPPQKRLELRGAVERLWRSTAPKLLLEGPARTGKTLGICAFCDALASTFDAARILWVRQTRHSLSQSVMQTFEDEILGPRIQWFGSAGREHRNTYEYPNGAMIVLGGMDHPERLYSTEWDIVCYFEAIESTRDEIERFSRGLSGRGIPLKKWSGQPYYTTDGVEVYRRQLILDTNPGAPGHHLNLSATPVPVGIGNTSTEAQRTALWTWNARRPVIRLNDAPDGTQIIPLHRLISRLPDNPRWWTRGAWSADGMAMVRELSSMTGHNRARLFEGRWAMAQGGVYQEFDESVHVVDHFEPPEDWPVFVGWDPGYDHVTAILWFTVSPDDTIFILDEIYRGGRSVREHIPFVTEKNHGRTIRGGYWGDPQEFFSDRAQGKSCAAQAAECGLRFRAWPRTGNAMHAMVNAVRDLLTRRRLFVMRNCVNTITEFQTWSYKRTVAGELPAGDDAYESLGDDAMDVIKGMVASNALRYDFARNGIIVAENSTV